MIIHSTSRIHFESNPSKVFESHLRTCITHPGDKNVFKEKERQIEFNINFQQIHNHLAGISNQIGISLNKHELKIPQTKAT